MELDKDKLAELIRLLLSDAERLTAELATYRVVCLGLRDRVPEIDALLAAVRMTGTISETVAREFAQKSAALFATLDDTERFQTLLRNWPTKTVH